MLRLLGYFFGIGAVLFLLVAGGVIIYVGDLTKDLPDYEVLARYEPPVTTRIHSADGQLMGEFATERRLFIPIQAVPDRVKAAFLSAEDKNFYTHPGVDFMALARAVVTNIQNYQSGRRMVGASTITQQVAKNFLLTNDRTIDRKIREAVLAFRIEQAYSKDRILELYLNEIFFGAGSYGIAGAALTYFGKSVNELNLQEAAYLAALPKAPNNYHPFDDTDAAIARRNWIIDRMIENGYVTADEAEVAKGEGLGVNFRRSGDYVFASQYFTEEVRKEIVGRYGKDALYEGGLSVRATLDPHLQVLARKALQHGLIQFDRQHDGYRGPVTTIDASGDWGVPLAGVDGMSDVPEWKLAVVLAVGEESAELGLRPAREISGEVAPGRETIRLTASGMDWIETRNIDGKRVKVSGLGDILSVGDVVYVENKGEETGWELQQVPEVSGALISMDPNTGRVLAMVGGFSWSQSQFNRATQAYRQPGSSFKPIVYAAALDNGYTPASVVMDAPIQLVSGGQVWEPKNYGGGHAGPSTLRLGIERSRNLMTVRLANDMGMQLVAEYAERFGVYDDLPPLLAMALGSGETTALRMVSAYSVMANGGRAIEPSFIDRVQDRYGRTIYKHDQRICDGCNASQWLGQDEPELIDNREQVLDPMTAYQITSMMEGVVQRGTATLLRDLGRPLAGKTGTTNDEKDAWFVGFTPNMVTGVYIGYDTPKPMGRGSTGGHLAAPVFKEYMGAALKDAPIADFRLPEGMNVVEIDRKTGMRSQGGPDTILEAFKPGTGPADSYQVIGLETVAVQMEEVRKISPRVEEAIQSGQGGLF
jgi:penicillin-binding protein 1A